MQMAGQQTIDSNSLNGIAHRNEQESPRAGTLRVFVLLQGISPHSLATVSICAMCQKVNSKIVGEKAAGWMGASLWLS